MAAESDRRNTRLAIRLALVSAVLILAQHIAGKAVRDTLFLTHFRVEVLPTAMAASAVLSIAAVGIMSMLMRRFSPARVLPTVLCINAAVFSLTWVAMEVAPRPAVAVLYLQVSVLGALLTSAFWAVLSDRFDPHSARRHFGTIAAAGTLGGFLGGMGAHQVAGLSSPAFILVVLAAVNGLAAGLVLGIGGGERSQPRHGDEPRSSALGLLGNSPFLQKLGLLVGLSALVATVLDYALKSQASAHFSSSEDLMGFFGAFYAGVGLLSFALQSLLGRGVLQRFGLGVSISVPPITTLVTALVAAVLAQFWAVVVVRATEAMLANSLWRSAFELLYTPLPADTRRSVKMFIDVGAMRIGDMAGSGAIMLLLLVTPQLAVSTVLMTAVAATLVVLYIAWELHHDYVEQLAHSLRSGTVSLEEDEIRDATTRETLVNTQVELDRLKLLEQIDDFKRNRGPVDSDVPPGAPLPVAHAGLAAGFQTLTSGDPEAIRGYLKMRPLEALLVPHVIPMLAESELQSAAQGALRRLGEQVVGQLTDAMLAGALPRVARLQIPQLLETCRSQRAVDALVLGLAEDDLQLRLHCSRGLRHMIEVDSSLHFNRSGIYALVEQELDAGVADWGRAEYDPSRQPERVNRSTGGVPPGLEHVLNLLSLALDPKILRMAVRALSGDDRGLRGTAMEYLDNVLPESIRHRLSPYLRRTGRRGS